MTQVKASQIEMKSIPGKRKITKTSDKIQLRTAVLSLKKKIARPLPKPQKMNILLLKKPAKIKHRVRDSTEVKSVKATTLKNNWREMTPTARSLWEQIICDSFVYEPETDANKEPDNEQAKEESNQVVKKPAKKTVKKSANNQVGLGEHSVPESSKQKSEGTTLFTVKEFSEKHHAFTESSLRNLIYKAKSDGKIAGNGMDVAIRRIGTRVYIDEIMFFQWVKDSQKT